MKKTYTSKKGARYETHVDNVVSLVRDGARFTFDELRETYLQERSAKKSEEVVGLRSNENVRRLISDTGMDATRMFMELLKKKYDTGHTSNITHLQLQRVSSAFVSGGFVPTAKNVNETASGVQLSYHEPVVKKSQRIVSTGSYYKTSKLKQDCVIIEASGVNVRDKTAFVAKVLGFFRVNFHSQTNELALVQYFDVIRPTSNAMKELGCVNLRWAREDYLENEGQEKCARWFDVIPASSIRGVVQVVSIDYEVKNMVAEKSWYEKTYHINRFFSNPKDIAY